MNKIININKDYSENNSKEDQYELGQSEDESESSEYIESWKIERYLDSEEENFLKVCHNKKRMRILSSSNSEDERMSIPSTSQNVMGEIEIAVNETQWIKLKAGGSRGRTSVRMIFKDITGPTGYAKRNIMLGCVTSAFKLIIDRHIMKYIKDCTEMKAHRVLKKDWTITVAELRSFLGILYARGAYETRPLKASYLWLKKWGPTFFANTMSEDKFTEILYRNCTSRRQL